MNEKWSITKTKKNKFWKTTAWGLPLGPPPPFFFNVFNFLVFISFIFPSFSYIFLYLLIWPWLVCIRHSKLLREGHHARNHDICGRGSWSWQRIMILAEDHDSGRRSWSWQTSVILAEQHVLVRTIWFCWEIKNHRSGTTLGPPRDHLGTTSGPPRDHPAAPQKKPELRKFQPGPKHADEDLYNS